MDILSSTIINIDGRLYVNYSGESQQERVNAPYHEEDETFPVRPEENGRDEEEKEFTTNLKVPSQFFKFIIGTEGRNKKKIEQETNCRIIIPPRGKSGDIVITSKLPGGLEAAETRIKLLLAEKRWKEDFTHFVSIPLTEANIKGKYKEFKTRVMDKFTQDRGVNENLFQNENKLHLTIATLVLLDEKECHAAIKKLQSLKEDLTALFQNRTIQVEGVEYMNDDPQMVDVLYAKVKSKDDSDSLQVLADRIANELSGIGLSKKEHDHVKLHATIMNSLHAFRKGNHNYRGHSSQSKLTKRETFDAKNILENFNNFYFGEFPLNEIHISKKIGTSSNGYYENLTTLQL